MLCARILTSWPSGNDSISKRGTVSFSVGGRGHIGSCVFQCCVKSNQESSRMSEREDNVYKAKLAEQAERYDGM